MGRRTNGQEDYWVVVLSTVGLLGGTPEDVLHADLVTEVRLTIQH